MYDNILTKLQKVYKVTRKYSCHLRRFDMAKKNAANVVGVKTKTTWKQAFKRDWQLYLLLLLPLIMVFVFSYGAYPGLRMAFMDY